MILDVRPKRAAPAHYGEARLDDRVMPCALGRTGLRRDKREGDHATPIGLFPFRRVLFRPDREAPPATWLETRPIHPMDGWCDDVADAAYNRPVTLPYPARHEKLWREDHLYDLMAIIGHNDDPVLSGAGSAIFIHVARPDFSGTEGCIAFRVEDLRWLLGRLDPASQVRVSEAT